MGGPRKPSGGTTAQRGSLEAARAAKAKLIPLLKPHLPDAAIGVTRDGRRFSIKINLCHPLRRGFEIPKTVGGVKVRAEVVGPIKKCRPQRPRAGRGGRAGQPGLEPGQG